MGPTSNIFDTALIIEGGGMRASYTAGLVSVLLEAEVYFDYVAGISAGATVLVNYLTRDQWRMRASFVDLVEDEDFGGYRCLFTGKGYFNARYIYEETGYDTGSLPFRFADFQANTAQLAIGAFNADLGRMHYWHKEDIPCLRDMMRVVRASSSLPVVMPPTYINGTCYVDGGLGESIALTPAIEAGYERFFVIRSQPRGYRKAEVEKANLLARRVCKPTVVEAMRTRPWRYNAELDRLDELERAGKAFVVTPDVMPVGRSERDIKKLAKTYELGRQQGYAALPKWLAFLFPGKKPAHTYRYLQSAAKV